MFAVGRGCFISFLFFFVFLIQNAHGDAFLPTDIVINAGGATFPEEIYPAWFKAYRDEFNSPEALSYTPTGSSTGIKWIEGLMQPASLYPFPIVFAGSDSPLQSADYQKYPDLQMFPTVSGAIVVVFNLPETSSLNLSREAVVSIFNGNISMWNHPILAELNPAVALPNKSIQLIVRRDGSGSSEVFTRGLSAFSSDWKAGVITDPKLISPEGPSAVWPSAVRFFGMGNSGIDGLVSSLPYSISYASVAAAVAGNLNVATIRNKAGKYIQPENISKGVLAAMDYFADQMDDRMTVFLVDAPVDDAYPFAMYTYMILNMSTHEDIPCEKVKLLVQVLQWTHSSVLAEQLAYSLDLVPLSDRMATLVEDKVIKNIMCQGRNVLQWIADDAAALAEARKAPTLKIVAGTVMGLAAVTAALLGAYQYRRRKIIAKDWLIPPSIIEDKDQAWRSTRPRAPSVLTASTSHSGLSAAFCNDDFFPAYRGFAAFIRDNSVLCFDAIVQKQPAKFKFKTSARLAALCRQGNHRNIAKLVGIVAHRDGEKYWFDDGIYHVFEDPGKTTLHSVLSTSPYRLNHGVMCSLALDVCNGMRFLARKGIIHDGEINDGSVKRNALFMTRNEEAVKRLLYTHPDILRGKVKLTHLTYEHDLYSFAMVLGEIFTREVPYTEVGSMIGWKSTLLAIIDGQSFPSCRPTAPQAIYDLVKHLTNTKWSSVVGSSSYDTALKILGDFATPSNSHKNKGIVDSLLSEMELYVAKLEAKMEDRAAGLKELNHRTKSVLDSFIPIGMATSLQAGKQPLPEEYKNATVAYMRYTFVGRKKNANSASDSTPAQEHVKLFEAFENIANANPLGVKFITLTGRTVMMMSGHDGKASPSDAAVSLVKFSLLIANSQRGRSTPVSIGISSGAMWGVIGGSQGQRFIVLGEPVERAKLLSGSTLPSTVRLSASTYGLVHAFLESNKIVVVPEMFGDQESYLAKFV